MSRWKRHQKVLVAVPLCLAVCIAFGYLLTAPHKAEPILKGKPVSVWVKGFPANSAEVYSLGSSAAPILLKVIERRQSSLTSTYRKLWSNLPVWVQKRWPRPMDDAEVRLAAAQMLSGTGDTKALISVLKRSSDPVVKLWVIHVLMPNTERAVTLALIEALRDNDPRVRGNAVLGLGMNGRDIQPAIPDLINCIRDKDPLVRQFAIMIASVDSEGYNAALPEIKRALKDLDERVRDAATRALKGTSP